MVAIISKPRHHVELLGCGELKIQKIAETLSEVAPYYPDFKGWLYFTFRKGLLLGNRKVLITHTDGDLSGVALLKSTEHERKICTFFVPTRYRSQNIGKILMPAAITELGKKNIAITVSEERNQELLPLLSRTGFSVERVEHGYYRNNKSEYFYFL